MLFMSVTSETETGHDRKTANMLRLDVGQALDLSGLQIYRSVFKRLLDIILVLSVSLPVLVLVAALAVLIACDGGRPFYSQMRVGRGGRLYRLWKLRTMCPDAEAALEAHIADDPDARAEWDSTQKLKSDPRVTWFGHLLRRSSFDELPQLWNVLVGHMSLVGPRPMMPDQQQIYPGRAYFGLRPGITGPWQISARNESTFADRAWFDDGYDKALSFRTDLRILLGTVRVVLRGTGH